MLRLTKALLVVAAMIAGTAAGTQWTLTDTATAATTQTAYVSMQFNRFAPADITVAAGTTVVWTNDDYDSGEYHDVIAENGSFISETFAPGFWYSVLFETPGTYVYYCDLHEGMFGRVFVQ